MLKFSCFVTGDDYDILKTDTPNSKKKVSALASLVFIPVIIWFANGFLLINTVQKGTWFCGIMVGLLLSVLIFLIERNIIMADNRRSIIIFRYSLGVIIALLGAICLDEAIFKQDIDQQLSKMHKSIVDESVAMLEENNKSGLEKAQTDVDNKFSVWQAAINDAKREADGTGGSGIKGVHAITKIKLASAEVSKIDYDHALADLTLLRSKLDNEKIQQEKQVEASLQNDALLNRIKALFYLVAHDFSMGIVYFLFTAFLFFMEFIVVFLKSAWPKTNYERKLEMIEEIGRKRLERLLLPQAYIRDPMEADNSIKKAKELLGNSSISLYN
jgi:hypothetical protein